MQDRTGHPSEQRFSPHAMAVCPCNQKLGVEGTTCLKDGFGDAAPLLGQMLHVGLDAMTGQVGCDSVRMIVRVRSCVAYDHQADLRRAFQKR